MVHYWCLNPAGAGRDSVVGTATRYGLEGPWIESRLGGARFSAPGAHPAFYSMCTGTFPGVKRPGRGVDYPPPSSAQVKGRVQLYLYSAYGPSWLVIGWTLHLSNDTKKGVSCGNAPVWVVHSPNLDRKTNSCLLYTWHSTPVWWARFLIVNYCSDMFRPQLSANFRQLANFSTCVAYVKLHLRCDICYINLHLCCYVKFYLRFMLRYIRLHVFYVICFVMLNYIYLILYLFTVRLIPLSVAYRGGV